MPLALGVRVAVVLLVVAALAGCTGSAPDDSPDALPTTSGSPDPAVDTLITTGLSQLDAGDEGAAATTFRNVLALEPSNVFAHYNLGVIAQDRGQDERARESYEQSLAADGTFAPALYNLGILTETEDLDAAVALYRRATEADPEYAPAFMRLGFALVHLGQEDEGATFLQRGIELDPSLKDVEAPSYR